VLEGGENRILRQRAVGDERGDVEVSVHDLGEVERGEDGGDGAHDLGQGRVDKRVVSGEGDGVAVRGAVELHVRVEDEFSRRTCRSRRLFWPCRRVRRFGGARGFVKLGRC
jgi:hypothetical protein